MTIEASRLRIALHESERWRRTLNVTVPAELVREEQQKAATKLAKKMKLPGFRAGRIPFSVVEKRFGPLLNQEMLDKVVGEAYREALRAEALRPISEGEVSELTWEPEQDLVFSISFDVHPEVDLAQLGGFEVQRPRMDVGEAELERVLTRLREQGATWWPVETGVPQVGDQVSVTVQRLDPGRESDPRTYEVVLGEGNAIPDVEASIATLEPGSTADFSVRFPEDDGSGDEATQLLRITLLERKIRELPDLDDAFARSVGDFETLDALKARLKEDLEREAEAQSEAAVRGQLLDHILQANPFDLPQSMLDGYIDSLLGVTK
jgi:trigger factor